MTRCQRPQTPPEILAMASPTQLKRPLPLEVSMRTPTKLKRRRTQAEAEAADAEDFNLQRDKPVVPECEGEDFFGESDRDIVDENSSMFQLEWDFMAPSNYMEKQHKLDCSMRSILIDALVDLHRQFRLPWTTLFLAVNLVDRYLAEVSVCGSDLELVGVTCMHLASKFVEVKPPPAKDLVERTEGFYTPDEISTLECSVLKTLNFRLACPTADHFLERLRTPNGSDEAQHSMACYLIELTVMDVEFLAFPPSHIAAAATLLSNTVLQREVSWPEGMVDTSRYLESALQSCVDKMRLCAKSARTNALQAVHKKYSSTRNSPRWRSCFQEAKRAPAAVPLASRREVARPLHSKQPKHIKEEKSIIYGVTYSTDKQCPSQPKRCLSVESRCELHKCPASRIAVHRQAFEGICRHTVSRLKEMCKARRLQCTGTKEEMALRLIDAMFH